MLRFVLCAVCVFLGACAAMPEQRILEASIDGGKIECRMGDAVVVSLKVNAHSGCLWRVSADNCRSVALESRELKDEDGDSAGGSSKLPTREVFVFRCVNAGTTNIVFSYSKPACARPVESANFTIVVK